MPVGPFQRDLEQVLGGRPVVPGQQQRGPEQTGRGALDELLERHARLPHRHASYSPNASTGRQVERITEIVVEPAPRVCVNFVGADVFLLVAGLIWLARSHPDGNLLVSASNARYAAAEQPVWRVVRNQTWPA